ncbi:hypothetical protein [Pyxidicoccus sp. MSG2]|uniref:hypothetical protein n=1 Tax=Pyxidicoccus sp. MSG2 TaxID=2996790 RepID=UPI0022716A06|nr:hypothetical protein [Pyxidicoccus sp. MSG2]MCY1019901.1 hypothetical protein [Pyxidicoccus sp. MSG2]
MARWLRRASGPLGLALCCVMAAPGAAQEASPRGSVDFQADYLVEVEAVMTDGTTRKGQALACASHRGGVLLVSANSLLRSELPEVEVSSLRVARAGFMEPVPASLLEFRDHDRNLGLLFVEGSLGGEPPTHGCEQLVEAGARATVFRRSSRTGELETIPGMFIRPFEKGRAQLRMAFRPTEAGELLGAPVLLGDVIAGLVVGLPAEGEAPVLQVASIEGLMLLLAKHGISPAMMPQAGCLWDRLAPQPESRRLRSLIAEQFVPGRSWSEIHRAFAPSDAELLWLFGPEAFQAIKAVLYEKVAEVGEGRYEGPSLGRMDVLTWCFSLNELAGDPESPYHFEKSREAVACEVTVLPDDNTLALFVLVNGRWIWLPTD